jgi:hypothetical protein
VGYFAPCWCFACLPVSSLVFTKSTTKMRIKQKDKVDDQNVGGAPKGKVKFDLVSVFVVIASVLFLFYVTLTSSTTENAFVVGAMIIVFPLSFRIPLLLLTRNRTRGKNIELVILLFIYVIGLTLIATLSPEWKAVFIFPLALLLMTGGTLIKRLIKAHFFFK